MIDFASRLVEGELIQRYKRFFADVRLPSGEVVTAHCANTGSMKTCGAPGDRVLLLHNPSPTRKLAYSWELTKVKGGYVGVNTARPNHLVAAAIGARKIPELADFAELKQEVKYGVNSRIDVLLTDARGKRCYVEVKNTTLLVGEEVQFPDAVTARGLKHLDELAAVVRGGERAVMFYLVNRPDGAAFAPARAIDPAYADGLAKAVKAGVEVLAYRAKHSPTGLTIGPRVTVRL
jgi:sugar fermentation stimulation protein A